MLIYYIKLICSIEKRSSTAKIIGVNHIIINGIAKLALKMKYYLRC